MNTPFKMNGLTDYFFAMPSFWSGFGRVLDVGGQFDSYNFGDTPEETDTIAIYNGWRAVGLEMEHAIAQFESELGSTTE